MKVTATIIDIDSLTLGDYIAFNTTPSIIRKGMIATGQDEATVKSLPKAAINAVIDLLANQIDSVKSMPRVDKIELEGVTYGLHPQIDKLTVAEFVDLEQCGKDWLRNIPKFMSILYRPIVSHYGSRYKIEDYDAVDRSELFKEMRYVDALGTYLFFWTLRNDLLNSLETRMMKMMRETIKEIATN